MAVFAIQKACAVQGKDHRWQFPSAMHLLPTVLYLVVGHGEGAGGRYADPLAQMHCTKSEMYIKSPVSFRNCEKKNCFKLTAVSVTLQKKPDRKSHLTKCYFSTSLRQVSFGTSLIVVTFAFLWWCLRRCWCKCWWVCCQKPIQAKYWYHSLKEAFELRGNTWNT